MRIRKDPDILFTMTVRNGPNKEVGEVSIWHRDGTNAVEFAQVLMDIAEGFLRGTNKRLD